MYARGAYHVSLSAYQQRLCIVACPSFIAFKSQRSGVAALARYASCAVGLQYLPIARFANRIAVPNAVQFGVKHMPTARFAKQPRLPHGWKAPVSPWRRSKAHICTCVRAVCQKRTPRKCTFANVHTLQQCKLWYACLQFPRGASLARPAVAWAFPVALGRGTLSGVTMMHCRLGGGRQESIHDVLSRGSEGEQGRAAPIRPAP
eukprot:scaffold43907_cov22-Tisochrysis_lutea.AAC.2